MTARLANSNVSDPFTITDLIIITTNTMWAEKMEKKHTTRHIVEANFESIEILTTINLYNIIN